MHTYKYTCTYTYTYTCIHAYKYTKTYINIHIHTNVHMYIHTQNEKLFTHAISKHISVKKGWYVNLPKHVNISESAHVIRKMNFPPFVELANDGSLFSSLLENNARFTSLSLQAVTKCSSFSATLQDRHNRSPILV